VNSTYVEGPLSPEIVVTPLSASNNPPQFTNKPSTQARVGVPYAQALTARDLDGDSLTFALVAGPAGMAVSPVGQLSWTPPVGSENASRVQLSSHLVPGLSG
jgi:hypothetical protein